MNILFFTNFYLPESIAPSFRAAENSQIWNDLGNEVVVFTGYPNHPIGHIFDGYTPKLLSKEKINGVSVVRCKLIAKPSTSMARRLINTLSFYVFGLVNIIFNGKRIGKDYDVVLGTSPIIFTALLAKNYARIHKLPFVFELRDLTHLQLIATGRKEKSKGVEMMKRLELLLCRAADKVIVVTHGFKRILIDYGIDSEKISVITNGVDVTDKTVHKQIKEELILSYYGTIGISQNISDTFQYAKAICECISSFRYRIIGDGAQKTIVEQKAKEYFFVDIMPGMKKEKLEPFYEETLLSVITLRKNENFRYTIPSKLFQIMGRGIAVLFIGPDGEAADIIRKFNSGIVLTGTVEEDLAKIRDFFSKSDWKNQLLEMGNNGYKAVKENYSRRVIAEEYERLLYSVVNNEK